MPITRKGSKLPSLHRHLPLGQFVWGSRWRATSSYNWKAFKAGTLICMNVQNGHELWVQQLMRQYLCVTEGWMYLIWFKKSDFLQLVSAKTYEACLHFDLGCGNIIVSFYAVERLGLLTKLQVFELLCIFIFLSDPPSSETPCMACL